MESLERDGAGEQRGERSWLSWLLIAGASGGGLILLAFTVLATSARSTCTLGVRDKAPLDIVSICAAIESYVLANDGRSPESLEVLVTPDERGNTMLKNRTVIPLDPWGNPYGYEPSNGERRYRVYSLGHDGQPGGKGSDADIDNFTIAGEGKR